MKTALIIPTLNADRDDCWKRILNAVDAQTFVPDLKLVIDSSSGDMTRILARDCGWNVLRIRRERFNHGGTRNRLVRLLNHRGFDAVVFLSQDVELSSPDSLKNLVDFLRTHDIAGCYGRQIVHAAGSFDAWQRKNCYPEHSRINTREDDSPFFFSDAFAAWKVKEVLRHGNFPVCKFGEDTLLASQIIRGGGRTGYCAEAVGRHEHPETVLSLFRRGFEVGELHGAHPELRGFHATRVRLPLRLIFPFAVKAAGYVMGRRKDLLIPALISCAVLLLLLPALLFSELPKLDVACRYAPMAEAFAAGDWEFAFHPRVTPLLPVCAGILAKLFPVSGWAACQMASALFLALSVFPVFFAIRRIYGFGNAVFASALIPFCSYLMRLGYFGLRETAAVFGASLLLYAAALLHDSGRRPGGYLAFAFGAAVLLLSRGDTALFVAAASLILLIWDFVRHRHPLRSLAAGGLVLLILFPQMCYNYRMIGWPVPEYRHAMVLRRLSKKLPLLDRLRNPAAQLPLPREGSNE